MLGGASLLRGRCAHLPVPNNVRAPREAREVPSGTTNCYARDDLRMGKTDEDGVSSQLFPAMPPRYEVALRRLQLT